MMQSWKVIDKTENCKCEFQLNLTVGTEIASDQILSLYTVSKEFELKSFTGIRHETPDPCCKDNFADVT